MPRFVVSLVLLALTFSPGIAVGAGDGSPPATGEEILPEPESPEVVMETVLGLTGVPVVQVESVSSGSVGKRIGLENGDLIVAVNGWVLREFHDFSSFVRHLREEVYFDGTTLDLLRYEPRTGTYFLDQIITYDMPVKNDPAWNSLGIFTAFGYLVLEVKEESPGHRMGVLPGDFIQEINDIRVPQLRGPADLDQVVEELSLRPGEEIRLRVGHWQHLGHGKMLGRFRETWGSL